MDNTIVGYIYETKDYDLFKFIIGNREISKKLLKMKKYMNTTDENEYGFCAPLIVNEKYEIIDGQHRFELCKKNNQPIRYIIIENSDLETVKKCNAINNAWSQVDMLNSLAASGDADSIVLKYYASTYELTDWIAYVLLTNKTASNLSNIKLPENYDENFIYNYEKFSDIICTRKINSIENKFLAVALVKKFREENYDHERFLTNIDLYYKEFKTSGFGSISSAYKMINDIYNR